MTSLTRDDINYILELVQKSDFDELKLEMGDLKLALSKTGGTAPAATPTPASDVVTPAIAAPTKPKAPISSDAGTAVPAPLLGTFYHAPKPGADPFVQVGDVITETSIIGIIEVMKLMNQVQSGVAGTVVEITAPNGELVEHGQTLIRVQP